MKLNGKNSDDYLYLRLMEDTRLPNGLYDLKAGTIVRMHIASLKKNIWKNNIRDYLMGYVENETCIEAKKDDNLLLHGLVPINFFKCFVVKNDFDLVVSVNYGDLIVMNDWLKAKLNINAPFIRGQMAFFDYRDVAHFNSDFFKNGTLDKSPTNSSGELFEVLQYNSDDSNLPPNTDGKLICKSGDAICLQFKKGEVIDFSNPAVALLFLNQEYIKFLLKTEDVVGEEKDNCFIKDFEGWIPEAKRRYFKIHDYIKIHHLNDILMQKGIFESIVQHVPDFQSFVYGINNFSFYDDFDFDEEGFLRYVWSSNSVEFTLELAKIADPVTREVGEEHYRHEITMKELLDEERELKYEAEKYYKAHQARFWKLKKVNPKLDYITFMIEEKEREEERKNVLVRRLVRTLNYRIDK